ncbi:Atypical/PDHK/BCKDK protein kinase [Meredithblackwellia eburnea MCA 4105]
MARRPIPHFYLNKTIESFAQKPSTPISLKHLINFGAYGRNKGEKQEAETLLKGGNFLRTELPTRLSHRLRDLQELPYVVASHPRMEHVYEMYLEAFDGIRKFPLIKNLEDNDRFCDFMQGTLDKHRIIIPELAIGVAEASPIHFPPQDLDTFMTRMLRSRISRRVITEQHIALTSQFRARQSAKGKGKEVEHDRKVGVVDFVNPREVINHCMELITERGGPEGTVKVNFEGDLDVSFAYIPEHLEFMVFELIKAAVFATTEHHGPEKAKDHPILVTIVDGAKELKIRVSDEGGGILPWGGLPDPYGLENVLTSEPVTLVAAERLEIFSFSHMRRMYLHHAALPEDEVPHKGIMALRTVGRMTGTVQEQLAQTKSAKSGAAAEDMDLMDLQMKSGIGLPLAKMFAEYFSGTLQIFTMMGHGSDQILTVSKFGHAA